MSYSFELQKFVLFAGREILFRFSTVIAPVQFYVHYYYIQLGAVAAIGPTENLSNFFCFFIENF